jgi:hypothetical protein
MATARSINPNVRPGHSPGLVISLVRAITMHLAATDAQRQFQLNCR